MPKAAPGSMCRSRRMARWATGRDTCSIRRTNKSNRTEKARPRRVVGASVGGWAGTVQAGLPEVARLNYRRFDGRSATFFEGRHMQAIRAGVISKLACGYGGSATYEGDDENFVQPGTGGALPLASQRFDRSGR